MPESFTTVVGLVWTELPKCVDMIIARPILMLPVGFAFAGGIIGLSKGLLRFGRRRKG